VEKLVSRLGSSSKRKREEAVISLLEKPPHLVVPAVAQLVLDDSDSTTQGLCLDVLERLGAAVRLRESRADGWFQRLGERIGSFDTICALMGERFLAYAIILGIQIRTLSRDPRVPANTTVEFCSDDNMPQVLTLGEFRSRVVQALLQSEWGPLPDLALPLDEKQVVEVIGPTNILLAPLFELSIRQLIWVPDEERPRAVVGYLSESGFSFVPIEEFISMLRQKLHRDLAGTHEDPFQLDLNAVEDARRAADEGDHDKVIRFLENWPGLLATLQRTPVAGQLSQRQLDAIAEGLVLLGNSFKARNRLTWAEELYRLGLQFVKEGGWAARLFCQLGVLLNETERHGEAIGLLRRAQALGIDPVELYPFLGRSFLRRGKLVPAVLLLKEAKDRGVRSEKLEHDLEEARRMLALAKVTWPTV